LRSGVSDVTGLAIEIGQVDVFSVIF